MALKNSRREKKKNPIAEAFFTGSQAWFEQRPVT